MKNNETVKKAIKDYSQTVLKIAFSYTKNVFDAEDIASDAATDETWYMLVMSEVFAGEYRNALDDCESAE